MSYDIDITKTPPAHEPERQYYYMAKAKDFVEKKSKEIGRPMTYFVKTFGCQMNARDSENLSEYSSRLATWKELMSTRILLYTTPAPYVRMLTTRCMAGLDICRTTRKRILL